MPSRKRTAPHANTEARRVAPPGGGGAARAQGRSGASPVWPGGSVSDSEGPGGHRRTAEGVSKEAGILQRGEEAGRGGICSSWEGGPQGKEKKKKKEKD